MKNLVTKAISKTAGGVANGISALSALSPKDLEKIKKERAAYLKEMPDLQGQEAKEYTKRLLAACGIDIYKTYITDLSKVYFPVSEDDSVNSLESAREFAKHNIRFINITRLVNDKAENYLEKLANVYEVLSSEDCNISLIFHRTVDGTETYLAVSNNEEKTSNYDVDQLMDRLADALQGNFPGIEFDRTSGKILPCFDSEPRTPYSVAIASNTPAEKSEKFTSQTIEKLLDGIRPDSSEKEYILILMATPIVDTASRKLKLEDMYSALVPYSTWTSSYTYNENSARGSSATIGAYAGGGFGNHQGQNQAQAVERGTTETVGRSKGETIGESVGTSEGQTHSDGTNKTGGIGGTAGPIGAAIGGAIGGAAGGVGAPIGAAIGGAIGSAFSVTGQKGENKTDSMTNMQSTTSSHGRSLTDSLSRAVNNSVTDTVGTSKGVSAGINFGLNFARSSTVTESAGKSEGITQTLMNYNIKHALEILEKQLQRYEQSSALGMWDFAAYVLSPDYGVASNVAHTYISLTQGDESYMTYSAVNKWKGDKDSKEKEPICAKAIFQSLRELRHPVFGLNRTVIKENEAYLIYPAEVKATIPISGKELAYSMNFPRKSISGLPVVECAEFGRDVFTYEEKSRDKTIEIGKIFHMNHKENLPVSLSLDSLASHVFVTGSTGAGKSNTVLCLLEKAIGNGISFLVIEPSKGEYKNYLGNRSNVSVFGTNPRKTQLLRLNPFSFNANIHVLEHLDRLVEIFNACWPMYAAMPAVLKRAIEKSYEDCGWNLLNSENMQHENIYPTFEDVARNIREIIESSEYDAENKGAYKGSLLTRLRAMSTGLNRLIFSCDEIPDSVLFDQNTIVDLSRVGSSETKSLIMGMLVLKLQEYRIAAESEMNSPLRHITVMEEAHNLLKRTSIEFISEGANLAGKSVEMLSNAIAEMRTYGEGFVIADQAPGLLDMSVIRNTNTKIIMRLPDLEDRELVGKAANLNDDQIGELAKLPLGVAAIYQNEWIQPVLCKIDKFSGSQQPYLYHPDGEMPEGPDDGKLAKMLLDYILGTELHAEENQSHFIKFKDAVMNSHLNGKVKNSCLRYLSATEGEARISELGRLAYYLSDAGRVLEEFRPKNNSMEEWCETILPFLIPGYTAYPRKDVEFLFGMILQEQTLINPEYRNVFLKFSDDFNAKWRII